MFAAPFVNFSYQILVEEVPCWDRKWGSGHLGSVGLPFLGVTSGAPVHSVLRLGSVQQHLRIKMRTKTKIETRLEMLVTKVTLRLAIACSCVAFSSTLPEMKKSGQ